MPKQKSGHLLIWVFSLVAVTAILVVFAGGPLTGESPESYSQDYMLPNIGLVEDKSCDLSFTEAKRLFKTGPVQQVQGAKISIGFSNSAWWGMASLRKAAVDRYKGPLMLEFTKPALSSIRVYIPLRSGPDAPTSWLVKTSGEAEPSTSRDVLSRSFIFLVPSGYDPAQPIYFRIESYISINTQVLFWLPQKLISKVSLDSLLFGLVYGVMAAMSLYNLILFLFLRENVYLHYVFYVLSVAMYLSVVYGHFPALVAPADGLKPFFRVLIAALPIFFGPYFIRSFLNIKKTSRFWNRVMVVVMVLAAVCPLMSLIITVNATNQFMTGLGFASGLLFLAVLADYLRRGYKPARFLMIAWSTFIFGVMIFSLGGIVIPRTPITVYTMAVGAALESILLSFALADRIRLLRRSHEMLSVSHKHFRELAVRDGLTGLYNRRYTFEQLPEELETVKGIGGDMSLMMMDVDNFKHFNDTYGHPEGDKVLVKLAEVIAGCIRAQDSGCRYGGEEFVVVLPGTAEQDAFRVAERIRIQFSQSVFNPKPDESVQVTVSIGLTSLQSRDEDADKLIKQADAALYEAKSLGKNQTFRLKT